MEPLNADTLAQLTKEGVDVTDIKGEPKKDDALNPDINLDLSKPKPDLNLQQAKDGDDKLITDPDKDRTPDITLKPDVNIKEPAKPDVDIQKIPELLEAAGFVPTDVDARIEKDKGITPEFITELKAKVDPDQVDAYVAEYTKQVEIKQAEVDAKKAEADTKTADQKAADDAQLTMNTYIYETVGGEANFKAMATILNANADKATVDLINAKLRSDDKTIVQDGLTQAVNAYNKATGREQVAVKGDSPATPAPAVKFISKEDYYGIMATEKYKTDPVYQKQIDAQRVASMDMDAGVKMPGNFYGQRDGRTYAL